jgi:uncharacterized DUF497 family protein
MKIVWDEPKRQKVLKERGYDLADIDEDFFETARIVPGHSGRFKAIGPFRGNIVTVVFTPLGSEAVSLVTMWRTTQDERQSYD